MEVKHEPLKSEHDIAIPMIVLAALVVGALGGYAYGLGRGELATNEKQEAALPSAATEIVTPAYEATTTPTE